jgi:homoserine O-acetyltransferase
MDVMNVNADSPTENTTAQTFVIDEFKLRSGVVMRGVEIAYRTRGKLAPGGRNAVLITHGYTSGPQMIEPAAGVGEGAWNEIVGPGKPVDTDRFFVVCPNMLGSSYGSTNAASINPSTGKRYAADFPELTVSDIVASQYALLKSLGVTHLFAIVGPSYGGFQAFQWAVDYPDFMSAIAPVVTSPMAQRERSETNVANLKATFGSNPNWHDGNYYDHGGVFDTLVGIRTATLKNYGIEARLRETLSDPVAIEAAIRQEASHWAREFDANSLLILGKAMGKLDVSTRLREIKVPVLYILSRTDKLFPPTLAPSVMKALEGAGVAAEYFELDSEFGHSASGKDARKWAPTLREFLSRIPT